MSTSITREQAIKQLRSFGFAAGARDWAYGETIFVPLGEAEVVPMGPNQSITVYPTAVYLYPDADGWSLLDLDPKAPNPAARYPDLACAVVGVREYAQQWENARA